MTQLVKHHIFSETKLPINSIQLNYEFNNSNKLNCVQFDLAFSSKRFNIHSHPEHASWTFFLTLLIILHSFYRFFLFYFGAMSV